MKIGKHEFSFGERTLIMGILNATPDSFSDGGKFDSLETAVERGLAIVAEGGDLIDIGGESTKPGAEAVGAQEEMRRILGPIRELVRKTDLPLSVDTTKGTVAEAALLAGASMINDVNGLHGEDDLGQVVAHYGVPVCIMMNRRLIPSSGDVLADLDAFMAVSLEKARKFGIREDRIILDPGVGFGLSAEESFRLIHHLRHLKAYGYPVLLGASRKRIIWQTLGVRPEDGLEGTLATTAIGIWNGADIIRVHDVKENVACAKISEEILKNR